MRGLARLQPVTEHTPEDADVLHRLAQLIAAGDASGERMFEAGRAFERSLAAGREAPRRRHRSTGRHQPFLLRLVK